ncbi:hypothetical protein [Fodinicola acaciae]|uniref:hypothetical protein n=1 Tax=Fodinicola acaciae TaxID=2681555 RepID=UPI0013D37CE5|nr:hypothetical protein [Fodinicola acaciae]
MTGPQSPPEPARQEFLAALHELRALVGRPTLRQLQAAASLVGRDLPYQRVGELLKRGRSRWSTVESFVLTCKQYAGKRRLIVQDGTDPFDLRSWQQKYDRGQQSTTPAGDVLPVDGWVVARADARGISPAAPADAAQGWPATTYFAVARLRWRP